MVGSADKFDSMLPVRALSHICATGGPGYDIATRYNLDARCQLRCPNIPDQCIDPREPPMGPGHGTEKPRRRIL